MSVDPKIVARIEKLLRLAAPTSGTTEPERQSAALEAAKLFAQHDLCVKPREPVKKRASQPRQPYAAAAAPIVWPPSPPPSQYRRDPFQVRMDGSDWMEGFAARDAVCVDQDCVVMVRRGDPVWMRLKGDHVEYLHRHGPCGW